MLPLLGLVQNDRRHEDTLHDPFRRARRVPRLRPKSVRIQLLRTTAVARREHLVGSLLRPRVLCQGAHSLPRTAGLADTPTSRSLGTKNGPSHPVLAHAGNPRRGRARSGRSAHYGCSGGFMLACQDTRTTAGVSVAPVLAGDGHGAPDSWPQGFFGRPCSRERNEPSTSGNSGIQIDQRIVLKWGSLGVS